MCVWKFRDEPDLGNRLSVPSNSGCAMQGLGAVPVQIQRADSVPRRSRRVDSTVRFVGSCMVVFCHWNESIVDAWVEKMKVERSNTCGPTRRTREQDLHEELWSSWNVRATHLPPCSDPQSSDEPTNYIRELTFQPQPRSSAFYERVEATGSVSCVLAHLALRYARRMVTKHHRTTQ